MPTYQLTFIFVEQTQGWSETWYLTSSSLTEAEARVRTVAAARALCLNQQVAFEAARISDVSITGDSKYVTPVFGNPQATLKRDIVQMCILFRVEAGMLYRRSFMMRGLPDGWVEYSTSLGRMIREDPCIVATNAYLASVIAAQFQLKVISKDIADTIPSNVTAVASTANIAETALTMAPGFTLGPDDWIRIKKMKGNLKSLNGVWKTVKQANSTNLVLNTPFLALQPFTGPDFSQAVVYKQTIKYLNVTDYDFIDARSRQTGRAPFVPAGRRRVRRASR